MDASKNPSEKAPRDRSIDFAKGVLILLVTTGHALQYAVHRDAGFWTDPFFTGIYIFHMPLFMAISGYLSSRSIDRLSTREIFRSRFLSLVVPIFTWTLLYCLVAATFFHASSAAHFSKFFAHEVTQNLWFLWALFASIILTALVRMLPGYFLPFYALSFFAVFFLPDRGILYLWKYTYPFFQLGYLAATRGVPAFFSKHRFLVFLISLTAAAVCFYRWTEGTYVYVSQMRKTKINLPLILTCYAGGVAGSLAALYVIHSAYRRLPEKITAGINALGRDSIYLYIIQGYLFLFVVLPVSRALPTDKPGLLLGGLIALLIGVVIGIVSWSLGKLLARSRTLDRFLFGRSRAAVNRTHA